MVSLLHYGIAADLAGILELTLDQIHLLSESIHRQKSTDRALLMSDMNAAFNGGDKAQELIDKLLDI